MEEVIERGYTRLLELIQTHDKSIDAYKEEIRSKDADLLARMGEMTISIVEKIGIEMLEKGKKDSQGEIYDARHYSKKMIVLGKSAELAPYRPDDMSKKVIDQFLLLGGDGRFYEIMYSADVLVIDSYLGELTPRQVIDLYGYDGMFMLYKAMQQYLENQEKLISGFETTISFLRDNPRPVS